jgi:hypothetical protein
MTRNIIKDAIGALCFAAFIYGAMLLPLVMP